MNNRKRFIVPKEILLGKYCRLAAIATIAFGWTCLMTGCGGSDGKGDPEETPIDSPKDEAGHEDHSHGDLIELDDHDAEHFGVETQMVSPSDFSEVLRVSGQIETKATDEVVAVATRSGILTLSPNINTGTSVGKGTAIASVNPSAVQGGDPSVSARASRDAAKRELERLTPLHKEGVVSAETYNAALRSYEEAEAALKTASMGSATVVTPKSGVITKLLANSGEYVDAGQKIAVISGNTHLTLRADVPEKYMGRIPAVESANFRASSSDEVLELSQLGGRLISNPGAAVAQKGYIPLYFVFNNDGRVAPGAFAEVYLKGGARPGVIAVPKEAIVEISGNKCVYSKVSDGHYAKHVVTTGATDGRNVEILSGLHNGESVVVKGAGIVRMAETSSTAVPGHTHNH